MKSKILIVVITLLLLIPAVSAGVVPKENMHTVSENGKKTDNPKHTVQGKDVVSDSQIDSQSSVPESDHQNPNANQAPKVELSIIPPVIYVYDNIKILAKISGNANIYRWKVSSDVQGDLSGEKYGKYFQNSNIEYHTRNLSRGIHTIKFEVWDENNQHGEAIANINVSDRLPISLEATYIPKKVNVGDEFLVNINFKNKNNININNTTICLKFPKQIEVLGKSDHTVVIEKEGNWNILKIHKKDIGSLESGSETDIRLKALETGVFPVEYSCNYSNLMPDSIGTFTESIYVDPAKKIIDNPIIENLSGLLTLVSALMIIFSAFLGTPLIKKNKENKLKKYFKEGSYRYGKKDYNGAIKFFKKIIKENDKCALAYFLCGNSYYQLDKYDEAIDCFNEAISIDNNYVEAYEGKSLTYHAIGQESLAERASNEANKIKFESNKPKP